MSVSRVPAQLNGYIDTMTNNHGDAPMATAPPRQLSALGWQAATACAAAAAMAAHCASVSLHADDLGDRRECVERCFDAESALSAAASVLARAPTGERIHVAVALARAALIGAQECAAECAAFEDMDEAVAACIDGCRHADSALRSLLAELNPLAGDPADRDSST